MSVIEELDTAMVDTVRTIAREVAAKHADDVDRNARFPGETVEALRDAFALSAFVPREYGGAGASMSTIARCCLELGRECSNSAMVFAMHQIQVASIVRHIEPGSWFEDYLRRLVVEQRLIASVTSEVGTGGDMGSSIAAVIPAADGTASFEKDAPTVSYGIHADDLLTTLRSGPHAERNDQVLALSSRDQHHLEITGTWDVLGMRGTCSAGGVVSATFDRHQVLETPFSKVAVESMVPVSHILWANVWLGIAEDAFCRTRAFVKAAARRSEEPGPLPAALRLSRLATELGLMRAEVASALQDFNAYDTADRERLSTLSASLRFNTLKLAASEYACRVCQTALEINGIMGFRNDTPFSVGRHLRDTLSAPLMIANERIHQTNASLLLIAKEV